MTTQPEALRLAEMLETGRGWNPKEAAAELRRLYAENEEMRERLAQPKQKPMHPEVRKMWEDHFDKCFQYFSEQGPCETTGKQSLQVEQPEPVAWMQEMPTKGDETRSVRLTTVQELAQQEYANLIPLYTAPPPREWVGLTDEERRGIREWQEIQKQLGPMWAPMMLYLYDAIETKLKEKNSA